MLHTLFTTYYSSNQTGNTAGFGVEKLISRLRTVLLVSTIIGAVVTVFLGLLGYGVLGAPSSLALIFFWILLILEVPLFVGTVLVCIFTRKIIRMMRSYSGTTVEVDGVVVNGTTRSTSESLHLK